MTLLKRKCVFVFWGCIVFLLQSSTGFGQSVGEVRAARDGIFSFVEVNPADLLWGRYRVSYENLIFESLSLAWTGEFQESLRRKNVQERNLATGLSLQYYPQSVSLSGLFFRGESNLALSRIVEEAQPRGAGQTANLGVLKVAGDLGWRVRLSERLTGSAAYGLRTTLPQVLWSDNSALSKRWVESGDTLDVRVQINLGLLL